MKKITSFILACMFVLSSSLIAFAGTSETKNDFKITDSTTIGEVMRYTDPAKFYSYSEDMQIYLDTVSLKQGETETYIPSGQLQRETLAAYLTSAATSPKAGQLNYSGTITCLIPCPSIYLSAIAYDESGTVVSEIAKTQTAATKCAVANIKPGLSAGDYHVTFYGIIEAPSNYVPNPGIVEYTREVTVK